MSLARTFLDRLRNAGITDTDNEEQRLQKSLLFFATGLIVTVHTPAKIHAQRQVLCHNWRNVT